MTPDTRLSIIEEVDGLDQVKERVKNIPVAMIVTPSPFLADARVFPFGGVIKVATELEANGNPLSVIDLSGFDAESCKQIVADFVSSHPDTKVFGLTATTPQLPYAVVLAKEIHSLVPDARIILGGPHVTLTHTAYLQDEATHTRGRGTLAFEQLRDHFDILVVGDGEMAVFYALDPKNKQTVIDAGSLDSPLFMQRGTLDKYKIPDRGLIDMYSYYYYIDGHRAFSVISQLGCPFKCGFCGGRDSQVFRMTRTRSIENVITEIEGVVIDSVSQALGDDDRKKVLTGVMFYDDELNVTKGGLEKLCRSLIDLQKRLAIRIPPDLRERLGIQTETRDDIERVVMKFRGFVKAELFTEEQAKLMAEAGFGEVLSGVESGSDQILRAMQKGTTRQTNARAVQYAHQAGMRFKALMSIGHPGESPETIQESIEWAISNLKAGDQIDWTVITQYPGSPYYDRSTYDETRNLWVYKFTNPKTLQEETLYSYPSDFAVDVHNYKGIPGNYVAYVFTDHLTSEELVSWRDRAEQETRQHLGLPQIQAIESQHFEHSMGQGNLPPNILRTSGNIYQI